MDNHDHSPDSFNGREVEPTIIIDATTLTGTRQGSVCIHSGAKLTVRGLSQGSLSFRSDSLGLITGEAQGSLWLEDGAEVVITGKHLGSVDLAPGARLRVESGGVMAGSLHNEGQIDNFGTRGGSSSGGGQLTDHPGSTVKQLERQADGSNAYNF